MYSFASIEGSPQDTPNIASREHVLIKHKKIPVKSQNNPLKLALESRQNRKVWTVTECESIIANCTNPIGKVCEVDCTFSVHKLDKFLIISFLGG